MKPLRIAPSLLAADFAALGDQVRSVAAATDIVHFDVMDGHFVPNISFGIPILEAVRRAGPDLYIDCHLMTTNPDAYFDEFKAAGADLVTMHIEALPDPTAALRAGKDAGLDVGLVLNPPTPYAAIEPFVPLCDVVLIMSVHPGFGGQSFIESTLGKVRAARETVDSRGLATDIEIDGGISRLTAPAARAAGADILVAGTAVFGDDDPAAAVRALHEVASAGE